MKVDSLAWFFALEILKYAIAGGIIFALLYFFLVKPYLSLSRQSAMLRLKESTLQTTLPLRLQAYERMALFIERLNPSELLVRAHSPGLAVAEMQQLLINEVRGEFQHNITQQVYLSKATWQAIRKLKDDTIGLISNTARSMPADASSLDYSKQILAHLSSLEEDPYQAALALVKAEAEEILSSKF